MIVILIVFGFIILPLFGCRALSRKVLVVDKNGQLREAPANLDLKDKLAIVLYCLCFLGLAISVGKQDIEHDVDKLEKRLSNNHGFFTMSKVRNTKSEKLKRVSLSLEEDQNVKVIAKRYGVLENTIYNWRNAYDKYKEASFFEKRNKTIRDSERKIVELEKQLKEIGLEIEILTKRCNFLRHQTGI